MVFSAQKKLQIRERCSLKKPRYNEDNQPYIPVFSLKFHQHTEELHRFDDNDHFCFSLFSTKQYCPSSQTHMHVNSICMNRAKIMYFVHSCMLSCVQLFVTLWMDCNLPGSSVHGILQVRMLEWISISFSRGFSQSRDQTLISLTPAWQADSLPTVLPGKPRFD